MDNPIGNPKRSASPTGDFPGPPKRPRIGTGYPGGSLLIVKDDVFEMYTPGVLRDALYTVAEVYMSASTHGKTVDPSESSLPGSPQADFFDDDASRCPSSALRSTQENSIDTELHTSQQHQLGSSVQISHREGSIEESIIGSSISPSRNSCLPSTGEQRDDPESSQRHFTGTVGSARNGAVTTPAGQSVSSPSRPNANAWDAEVLAKFRSVFHLVRFNPGQREAINATLAGEDVFLNMPAASGKSVCYQLSAVCLQGKTQGLSVVISPLRSLVIDQEQHLVDLGVNVVTMLGGDQKSEDERKERQLRDIALTEPCLLYITPEKLEKSRALTALLDDLYRRGRLARFVIDEAHCIPEWRLDFRAAYNNLACLRRDYPSIPIMALSASVKSTAVDEICDQLCMTGCQIIHHSANRPNLMYEVRLKKAGEPGNGGLLSEMKIDIRTSHAGQTGIVYCQTKKKCEVVAASLTAAGIQARHYHGDMDDRERRATQKAWRERLFDVVVATTAFGMGIDNGDVRFVMHYGFPRTLVGYYQETARAGRDGQAARCKLYAEFSDWDFLKQQIVREGTRVQQKLDDLRDVILYCTTFKECRRTQLMRYFGEEFQLKNCHKMCDVCLGSKCPTEVEVTEAARRALGVIQEYQQHFQHGTTIAQALNVLCGASNAKAGATRLSSYNSIISAEREEYKTLFYCLHISGAIREKIVLTGYKGSAASYMIDLEDVGRRIVNRNATFSIPSQLCAIARSTKPGRRSAPDTPSASRGRPRSQTKPANGEEDLTQIAIKALLVMSWSLPPEGPGGMTLFEAMNVLQGAANRSKAIVSKGWDKSPLYGVFAEDSAVGSTQIYAVFHRLLTSGAVRATKRPGNKGAHVIAIGPLGRDILSNNTKLKFTAQEINAARPKNRPLHGWMDKWKAALLPPELADNRPRGNSSHNTSVPGPKRPRQVHGERRKKGYRSRLAESCISSDTDEDSVDDQHNVRAPQRSPAASRSRTRACSNRRTTVLDSNTHERPSGKPSPISSRTRSKGKAAYRSISSTSTEDDVGSDTAQSPAESEADIAQRAQTVPRRHELVPRPLGRPEMASEASRGNAQDTSDVDMDWSYHNNTPHHSRDARIVTGPEIKSNPTTKVAKLALSGIESALNERGTITLSKAWHVLAGRMQNDKFARDGWTKVAAYGTCRPYSLPLLKEVVQQLDACGSFQKEHGLKARGIGSNVLFITALRQAGRDILNGERQCPFELGKTSATRSEERPHKRLAGRDRRVRVRVRAQPDRNSDEESEDDGATYKEPDEKRPSANETSSQQSTIATRTRSRCQAN